MCRYSCMSIHDEAYHDYLDQRDGLDQPEVDTFESPAGPDNRPNIFAGLIAAPIDLGDESDLPF